MKDCGSSFHGKHLKSALDYITVLEKTQNGRLVAAVNCQVDMAFEQMKETKKNKVTFSEISKFPAVKRDLALLLDKSVQFAEIEKIAEESERKLLKEVSLFDVYEGKNLPAGKKSYAVSFYLQDETKTLNDKQIDAIMQKIRKNLESKLGASLR